MDNVMEKLNEHDRILDKHDEEITDLKATRSSFDTRIRNTELKDAVIETKLNTTNKILFGIFTVILGATMAFLFELFKGTIIKG